MIDQLKEQLRRHHLWAKKSLGQNFLVDENALNAVVQAAELSPDDHVVEVGAGTGLLTTRLAPLVGRLTSLEYDESLLPLLRENTASFKNVEVLHQDALKFQVSSVQEVSDKNLKFKIENYKVVANIPYYITSPLIKHFLTQEVQPSVLVFLIQKEVAEKICSKKKGKTVLTIETQVFGEPEVVATVPASSFYPSPKVDSAVLRVRVYDKPLVDETMMGSFIKVLHAGFSQKRKKLTNSLAAGLHIKAEEAKAFLERAGIDPGARAEHLEVADWERLTKTIY